MDNISKKSLLECIKKNVFDFPDKCCVVTSDISMSYREIWNASTRLAKEILDEGSVNQKMIGVLLNRDQSLVITYLTLLRLNIAIVPINPDLPENRIKYMLDKCNIKTIIASNNTENLYERVLSDKKIINVDRLNGLADEIENEILYEINESNETAFVLFTSGTTGRPKGIMIGYNSINSFFHGFNSIIPLQMEMRMLAATNVSFDISLSELIISLGLGITVVIANDKQVSSPRALCKFIKNKEIDCIQQTPSLLNSLINFGGNDFLDNVKIVLLAGEVLNKSLVQSIMNRNKNIIIFNLYGPTEGTIYSTFKKIDLSTDEVTIGKPLDEVNVYIVDNDLNIVKDGYEGQIVLTGKQVTMGYINQPDLMDKYFIGNIFDQSSEKAYLTGDMGRILPNGEIEYLGRRDTQIKIHGLRIETSEIEAIMESYEGVNHAVVLKKEKNNNSILYGVVEGLTNIAMDKLKKHLAKFLPNYMIPGIIVQIEKIPISFNGKKDRKKLEELLIEKGD